MEGDAQITSDEETRASRNHSHRARASQPHDQGLALRRRNSMPWVSLRVWLGSSGRELLKRNSMVRRPRSRKALRFTCLMRLSWRSKRSRFTKPRNTLSEIVRIRFPCRKSWLRLMRSEKMSSWRKCRLFSCRAKYQKQNILPLDVIPFGVLEIEEQNVSPLASSGFSHTF